MNSQEGLVSNSTDKEPENSNTSKPVLLFLDGMDKVTAVDFVKRHIMTANQIKNEILEIEDNIKKWTSRKKLAAEKQMISLENQAGIKLSELISRRDELKVEDWSLEQDIAQMKKELIIVSSFQPSVNSNELLEQMNSLVGKERVEDEKINQEIEANSLDDELALLKAKLKKNNS